MPKSLQILNKKKFRFTKTNSEDLGLSTTEASLPTYYLRCKGLPLHIFIDCFDGDLSKLRLSGTPETIELQAAWEQIITEFYDLTSTDDNLLNLVRTKQLLTISITITHECCAVLRHGFNQLAVDLLRKEGYFDDMSKPESIDRVMSLCKRKIFDLESVESEIKTYEQQGESNPHAIQETLVLLSKHNGYRIDPKAADVLEYTILLKAYNNAHKPKIATDE